MEEDQVVPDSTVLGSRGTFVIAHLPPSRQIDYEYYVA